MTGEPHAGGPLALLGLRHGRTEASECVVVVRQLGYLNNTGRSLRLPGRVPGLTGNGSHQPVGGCVAWH